MRSKDGKPLELMFLYQNNLGRRGDAAAELAVRAVEGDRRRRATAKAQNETTLTGTIFGAGDWDVTWVSLNVNSPDQLVPFLSGPAAPDGTNFSAIANADVRRRGRRPRWRTTGAEGCDDLARRPSPGWSPTPTSCRSPTRPCRPSARAPSSRRPASSSPPSIRMMAK